MKLDDDSASEIVAFRLWSGADIYQFHYVVIDFVSAAATPSPIEPSSAQPSTIHPNPFNPSTTID